MKLISNKRIELPYILFTIHFLFHTGFSPGLGCAHSRAYGQNIGFRNLIPAIMAGCNSSVKKPPLPSPFSLVTGRGLHSWEALGKTYERRLFG